MKVTIQILVLSFLLFGCNVRKKTTAIKTEKKNEIVKIDTNTVKSNEINSLFKEDKKQISNIDNKEDFGSVEINGKTDSTNAFSYYNINNGDTLQVVSIIGKADFIFKNNWKNSIKKEESVTNTEILNKVAEVARKSVAQSTIKEVAEEVKQIDEEVTKKGFPLAVYASVFGWGLLIILLVAVYLYYIKIFKKS